MAELSRFVWPVRVYYEDTDSGGVVYYANYLKFMERARTEWLRSMGFGQHQLHSDHGVLFAVRSVQIDYLRPAMLDDALEVSAVISEQGRASLVFAQEIARSGTVGQPLCRGRVKVACIDAENFRPCSIPGAVKEKMAILESTNEC